MNVLSQRCLVPITTSRPVPAVLIAGHTPAALGTVLLLKPRPRNEQISAGSSDRHKLARTELLDPALS